jgi:hypothetical protein
MKNELLKVSIGTSKSWMNVGEIPLSEQIFSVSIEASTQNTYCEDELLKLIQRGSGILFPNKDNMVETDCVELKSILKNWMSILFSIGCN